MGRDADIVVIGAGITGVATARALAQAGRGVILVEQFGSGHERGSSHGASRIFRLSYPDPHYVRLAQGALQSWRELEAECGEQLIVQTGGLDFGPVAAENARALAACGVRHELLTGAQVTARWPIAAEAGRAGALPAGRRDDPGRPGLRRRCSPPPSTPAPSSSTTGASPGSSPAGAPSGSAPTGTRSRRDACVVAAGAWARGLLAGVEIELPVVPTRETVAYFRLPDPLALPPVIDDAVPDAEEHGLLRPGPDQLRARGARASVSRPGSTTPGRPPIPTSRARPTRRSCAGCRPGRHGATRSSIPSRSRRRPASTRTRPTSRSCSSGTAASSSRPPARATASSSRPRSGARSPRSPRDAAA